ncbi:MAG: hypothetical protein LiPW15_699 [Parcubacteria group bacterium LiPW_15]|nr:MAG: hypothetical protein LiPW15_699 [Parcubacteria group bacterium LiPW_15]
MVRRFSAKELYAGSIPTRASKRKAPICREFFFLLRGIEQRRGVGEPRSVPRGGDYSEPWVRKSNPPTGGERVRSRPSIICFCEAKHRGSAGASPLPPPRASNEKHPNEGVLFFKLEAWTGAFNPTRIVGLRAHAVALQHHAAFNIADFLNSAIWRVHTRISPGALSSSRLYLIIRACYH